MIPLRRGRWALLPAFSGPLSKKLTVQTIRSIALLAATIWAQVACGQLVVQDQYAQHAPIVIRCEVPSVQMTAVTLLWAVDEDSYSIPCPSKNGVDELHVWAGPGEHWAEATIISTRYQEQEVLIRDPDAPTDPTKFKTKLIRITLSTDAQRFKKKFSVSGVPVPTPKPTPPTPQPPPIPDPPVPTPPTEDEIQGLFGLAPKVRDRVLLMPDATAAQIAGLAMNYREVATMISEDKLTVDGMQQKLAELNAKVLKTEAERKAWASFWPWLGQQMHSLDVAGKFAARVLPHGTVQYDASGKRINDPKKITAALVEIYLGLALAGDQQ